MCASTSSPRTATRSCRWRRWKAGSSQPTTTAGTVGNSLIREYLPAGLYFIEATTYYARDYQPLQADFTLTVRLVDELSQQQGPLLKVERNPDSPRGRGRRIRSTVHYRVGNIGGGTLPDDGSRAQIWLSGHAGRDQIFNLRGIWDAGVAYPTGDEAASATSTTTEEIEAFEATLSGHGPTWIFIGIVADDADGNELGWHGLWHNLLVLERTDVRSRHRQCRRRGLHGDGGSRRRREGDDDGQRHRRPGGRGRPQCRSEGGLRGGRAHTASRRHLPTARDRRTIHDGRAGPVQRARPLVEDASEGARGAVCERGRGRGAASGYGPRRGDQPGSSRGVGAGDVSMRRSRSTPR